MSEISELKELMETHRKESNEWRTDVSKSLAKIEVHNEYTQKKLAVVDELKTAHNKQRGFLYCLSLIGLGGIEEFIRHNFLK